MQHDRQTDRQTLPPRSNKPYRGDDPYVTGQTDKRKNRYFRLVATNRIEVMIQMQHDRQTDRQTLPPRSNKPYRGVDPYAT